jgi:Flp pilus assembly protein TadG
MTKILRILRRALAGLLKEDSGQMLPIVALMLASLMGISGMAVDVGRLMYTKHQLQASTDAAALAGAAQLPNSTAASVATQYSSVSGNLNAQTGLNGVSMVSGYPQIACYASLQNQGMACVSPANGNAIVVKQQVSLGLFFLRVLGISSMTVQASSTAAMRGATSAPYNVAIILDTTQSMNDKDSDSNCNATRISCAEQGVQILLQSLSPCLASLSTCGTVTSSNVANPVDVVSLYTFPAVTSATQATYDYDCSSSTTPTISKYTDPTYPIYQIVGFSSDYRSSDSSKTLSTTSSLVKAVGGVSGCSGMQAVGGVGTYFAGVIYKAQADLLAQQKAHPGTQNVMILLSDGDASATAANMPNSSTKGTYASSVDQCAQAVTAAAAATGAGTNVYAVAYGATSSGCSTDKPTTITPCQTMQRIASGSQYFYSDYTATGGSSSCVSAAQSTTGLNQIFTRIAGDLTVGRLIPDCPVGTSQSQC